MITGFPGRSRGCFCFSSISKLSRKQPCQGLHRRQNPKVQDLHSVSPSARLLRCSGSVWAARFYLVLTNCRPYFCFHCCGAAALRSSCIIEILVAALIIFHANLVNICAVCEGQRRWLQVLFRPLGNERSSRITKACVYADVLQLGHFKHGENMQTAHGRIKTVPARRRLLTPMLITSARWENECLRFCCHTFSQFVCSL